MKTLKAVACTAVILLASRFTHADDLTGATRILCSPAEVVLCTDDGNCDSGPAWTLNLPQFIEVDLQAKRLSTTAASAVQRTTPIKSVERADGRIIAQGSENGRAFSWVIDEATGSVTVAVAFDGHAVTAFGMCTPVVTPQPATRR